MDLMTGLSFWAQVPAQAGAANPNSIALLALRRWCGSLTLSSPRAVPGWHGFWALLAGLVVLFLVVLVAQGPLGALRQLFDIPGHVRLVRDGTRRVRRAGRIVAALIGFTVVSWTAAQSLVFSREGGRTDLLLLTRSRGLTELAAEQGVLAGLTPLRDVAGLADNLPLLIVAAIVLFRASIEPQRSGEPGASAVGSGRAQPGWTTIVWGVGALYILYRIVARAAGSPELPFGNCLVVETILIPIGMAIVQRLSPGLAAGGAQECRARRRGRGSARPTPGGRAHAGGGAGLRRRAAGSLCRRLRRPGQRPPAHIHPEYARRRLHPLAARRLGADGPAGRRAGPGGTGRGGRLDARPDRRGGCGLREAPRHRGRPSGRRARDGGGGSRAAIGGRVRRRVAPARAVLGPERG